MGVPQRAHNNQCPPPPPPLSAGRFWAIFVSLVVGVLLFRFAGPWSLAVFLLCAALWPHIKRLKLFKRSKRALKMPPRHKRDFCHLRRIK